MRKGLIMLSVLVISALTLVEAHASNSIIGVCYSKKTVTQANWQNSTQLLSEAGIKWLRTSFRREELEPVPGAYKFEEQDKWVSMITKHNISILGLVIGNAPWDGGYSYPPRDQKAFQNYLRTLVKHYPNIKVWEIWNEPDIPRFWRGSPEDYVNLLKQSYETIKSINPGIKVISAGLDGRGERYIRKLMRLGFQRYCDGIGFHPYAPDPTSSLRRVETLQEIIKKQGVSKPLWITEVGWRMKGQRGPKNIVQNEEVKAAYLSEIIKLLKPKVDAIFWYRGVDAPGGMGLIEQESLKLKLLPSYNALKKENLKY